MHEGGATLSGDRYLGEPGTDNRFQIATRCRTLVPSCDCGSDLPSLNQLQESSFGTALSLSVVRESDSGIFLDTPVFSRRGSTTHLGIIM